MSTVWLGECPELRSLGQWGGFEKLDGLLKFVV
jgi:hypothetical protein